MLSSVTSLRARTLVPVSALLLATACDPLSCQGRVTDGIDQIVIQDVPEFPPLCADASEFNDDVDITQQAQLDALSDCLTVSGNIFIHDSVDITSLGAIAKLERVEKGYIMLFNNAALTSADLPNLEELQAGFSAVDNPELVSVTMPQLPQMKGDLTLRNNAKLTTLDFSGIDRINNAIFIIDGVGFNVSTGNLILGDLPALTSIDGAFDNLEVIEGAVEVLNTGLTSFKGLDTLTDILNTGGAATARTKFRADKLNPGLAVGIDFNDKFDIVGAGNPNLENFDGLQNLNSIVGDVFIGFNPSLENFVGLDDIVAINGRLFVAENESLQNFTGLDGDNGNDGDDDGLQAINGDLFIGLFFDHENQPIAGGNAALQDFAGLDSLTTLTGNLVLAFSPAFEDFTGLDVLTTVGGDFIMLGLEPDSFAGADALTTINGDLVFGQLFRRDGFVFDPNEEDPTKQLLDVNGTQQDPAVKFNPNNGQNGFPALTTVGGDLVFAFSDFTDLRLSDPDTADLATVNGRLMLYGNANPDTLDGIQTVGTLGGFVVNFSVDAFGDLQPFENNGLADFSDLAVANLGAGGLHIGFNADLDNAAFASFPDFNTVAGDVTLARAVNQNNLGPTNLNDLNITNIGGNLTICAIRNGNNQPINANLGNLDALNLNATNQIGGDVFVGFCSNLENTTMTPATIGGIFELTELPALVTVNGMNQLTNAGGLNFHDLSDVEDIVIPNLANVQGNLEIVRDPAVTTIDFGLNTVGGTLRFAELGELPDLAGLTGLNTVDGDLDIIDCDTVANTIGLNQLDQVGGVLRLRRLDNISNEAIANGDQELTFNQLTQVGGLEVTDMGDLEDLAGLQTLSIVDGTVSINANPKLKTLFGLQGLTFIGRKLSIVDNPNLELAFFDDDNQDRVPDIDNGNEIIDEPNDPDDINESGLLDTLATIGEPENENDTLIGGTTGVIELRNNPKLDEAEFFDIFVDELNFEGLFFLCGNDGSVDVEPEDGQRLFSFAECPGAQDGIDFNASGGEGEGEGEDA